MSNAQSSGTRGYVNILPLSFSCFFNCNRFEFRFSNRLPHAQELSSYGPAYSVAHGAKLAHKSSK
jgi:hypothetical protein